VVLRRANLHLRQELDALRAVRVDLSHVRGLVRVLTGRAIGTKVVSDEDDDGVAQKKSTEKRNREKKIVRGPVRRRPFGCCTNTTSSSRSRR
jgi:hypothetical protein